MKVMVTNKVGNTNHHHARDHGAVLVRPEDHGADRRRVEVCEAEHGERDLEADRPVDVVESVVRRRSAARREDVRGARSRACSCRRRCLSA